MVPRPASACLLLVPLVSAAPAWRGFEFVSGLWDPNGHNHTFGSDDAIQVMTTYQQGLAAGAVALTFNGFVPDTGTPGPFYAKNWTPTAAQLTAQVEAAHAQGMKVMLRPVADAEACHAGDPYCSASGGGHAIGFNFSADDWDTYTDNYIAWAHQYAQLAEQVGAELFCIGVESWRQDRTNKANPNGAKNMRRIAAAARAAYSGAIVYSANEGVTNIDWWDAVDYIGFDAYFPLNTTGSPATCTWPPAAPVVEPSVEELVAALQPHVTQYGAIAAKFNRSVLFTEANLAEAMFQAWWGQSWFGGLFWWNVYTDPERNSRGNDFVPVPETQAVFRRWWTQ